MALIAFIGLLATVKMPDRDYASLRWMAKAIDRIGGKGTSTPFLPGALQNLTDPDFQGGFFFSGEQDQTNATGMGMIVEPDRNGERKKKIESEIRRNASGVGAFQELDLTIVPTIDLVYAVYQNRNGSPAGLYFETGGITPDIRGFGGPMQLGIAIDSDGRLVQVKMVHSRETPAYLQLLDRHQFYEQFINIDINGGSHTIDGVTGATVSSEAIARTVNESVDRIADSILGSYLPVEKTHIFRIKTGHSIGWYLYGFIIFTLFLLASRANWMRFTWFRRGIRVMAILLIGFWYNGSITYTILLTPFLGAHLPMMGGLVILLALLFSSGGKNVYCNHLCPYGNSQKVISAIFPGLRLPHPMGRVASNRIRLTVTAIFSTGILIGYQEWTLAEPFPYLFSAPGVDQAFYWIAILFFLLSIPYPTFWCRTACPTGAVLDLVGTKKRKPKKNWTKLADPGG